MRVHRHTLLSYQHFGTMKRTPSLLESGVLTAYLLSAQSVPNSAAILLFRYRKQSASQAPPALPGRHGLQKTQLCSMPGILRRLQDWVSVPLPFLSSLPNVLQRKKSYSSLVRSLRPLTPHPALPPPSCAFLILELLFLDSFHPLGT